MNVIFIAIYMADCLRYGTVGECVAVDFERKLYGQCVDVLLHHIKPQRTVPGVVLEHAYVSSMEESLRPLAVLCSTTPGE